MALRVSWLISPSLLQRCRPMDSNNQMWLSQCLAKVTHSRSHRLPCPRMLATQLCATSSDLRPRCQSAVSRAASSPTICSQEPSLRCPWMAIRDSDQPRNATVISMSMDAEMDQALVCLEVSYLILTERLPLHSKGQRSLSK